MRLCGLFAAKRGWSGGDTVAVLGLAEPDPVLWSATDFTDTQLSDQVCRLYDIRRGERPLIRVVR